VDLMDIELRPRNRLKEMVDKAKNKLEDKMFDLLLHIPTDKLPQSIRNKINAYLDKRLLQLKQESVKLNWKNVSLKQAVKEIQSRQQT
jgi:hypothetical protein